MVHAEKGESGEKINWFTRSAFPREPNTLYNSRIVARGEGRKRRKKLIGFQTPRSQKQTTSHIIYPIPSASPREPTAPRLRNPHFLNTFNPFEL